MNNLSKLKDTYARRYGNEYVNIDGKTYSLDVVPTCSLMLDYKTGIGGFPYGAAVEVFGANKLGKSSSILYPLLGNVQKQGKIPAIIASEPRLVTDMDREWARAMGMEPDDALILYPDNEQEAFSMLRDLVFDDAVDYIGIDSLGGLGTAATAQKDGKTTKAYGISGPVTSVLNDIMPRLYKNNIGMCILNQQRQTGNFNGTTLYDSPGGEGLHHQMRMRIHLKPGGTRFQAAIDGEKILVGREIKAVFVKNNMAQASEKSATFNFFSIETEEYGLGVDRATDVVNTGILTGVIKKTGGWLEHDTFPENKSGEHKVNGAATAGQFLMENDRAYDVVRGQVLASMVRKEMQAQVDARGALEAAVMAEADDDNE